MKDDEDKHIEDKVNSIVTLINEGSYRDANDVLTKLVAQYGDSDIMRFLQVQVYIGLDKTESVPTLKNFYLSWAADLAMSIRSLGSDEILQQMKRNLAILLANKGVSEINMHQVIAVPGACSDYYYGQQQMYKSACRDVVPLLQKACELDPANQQLSVLLNQVEGIIK